MTTMTTRMLCAAGAALFLATGCTEEENGPPPAFTQADLTGEWDILQFSTNEDPGWVHVHVRLDASGQVEALSILDDAGNNELPPPGFDMRATIDDAGTVRLVGADGSPAFHGTMAGNKTLVLATDEEGDPAVTRRNLHAWRKRVPGVTYAAADIASFSFAVHGINSGSGYGWFHGTGTTDADGNLTLGEIQDSSGNVETPGTIGRLSIDAAGLVWMIDGVLRGVMSADKNAIFFVNLSGDEPLSPGFLVVQRTGRTFALSDLAGDYAFHAVVSGAETATSSWSRGTSTISASGLLEFTSFANSAGSTTLPASRQLELSPAGVLTMPLDATFHGQLSWEEDFYVRTGGSDTAPMMAIVARR